jgi:hypothetical protein
MGWGASLRLMAADAFFFSINLFRALFIVTIISVLIGAIMYAMAKGVSFIFHLFCICS